MEPSSFEIQAIPRRYNVPYDDVLFYRFHHQIGMYLLLAGVVVMLWDHITTIPDEIKYVWQVRGRWTIATVLFGFNRYISPLGFIIRFIQLLLQTPDRPMCGASKAAAYMNILSFACVEIVLMMRVWVIFGKCKKLGFFLATAFVVALAISLILPVRKPTPVNGVIQPLPISLLLCARSSPSAYFWLLIIAASLETITFSLFCARVWRAWKDSMTTPLLNALFTQGAAYYIVILCTFAVSIPATMYKAMFIPLMDPNLIILVSCIACNRLILSLRGLYYSEMVVHPMTLGMLSKEGRAIQVSMPYTPSSAAATSLDTSALATCGWEDDGWVYVGSGDPGIGLESVAQELSDLSGPQTPTAEKCAAV